MLDGRAIKRAQQLGGALVWAAELVHARRAGCAARAAVMAAATSSVVLARTCVDDKGGAAFNRRAAGYLILRVLMFRLLYFRDGFTQPSTH
jgi:hypothetical protein